jgi:hypothetical protein
MTDLEARARQLHADWYRAVYNSDADQAEIDGDWADPLQTVDVDLHQNRFRIAARHEDDTDRGAA